MCFAVLCAGSLSGQSVTGMYSGTFAASVKTTGCSNMTSYAYAGVMVAAMTQSGNKLTGSIITSDPMFYRNEGGVCTPYRPWYRGTSNDILDGKASNSSIEGLLITFFGEFKGAVQGSTITGQGSNSAGSMTFTLTRTSTAVLPLILFGHARERASATGNALVHWSTGGATKVLYEFVNVVGPFGDVGVSPVGTTTFTLSATGPAGTATAKTTVKLALMVDPDVVVSVSPLGIVQQAGTPLVPDHFTLTNLGGTATDVTLTSNSSSFQVSPATFRLDPIASQVVSVMAATTESGSLHGSIPVSGNGVTAGLTIPVHRLVTDAPAPEALVRADARLDVSAPAGEPSAGATTLTNGGASTVQGVVTADVPWIVIANPDLTLGPGESKQVAFSVDRSLRPGLPFAGASGGLSFRYLNGNTTTAITDAVEVAAVPYSAFQLITGSFVYAPGATAASDLHLSNRQSGPFNASLVYFPPNRSDGRLLDFTGTEILPAYATATFPGVVRNVFGQSAQAGGLMVLGQALNDLSVAHTQINTRGGVSTVTALPVFRSDDALSAGEDLFLPGVQKSATKATTLYLQEMGGIAASVVIESLDSEGQPVGNRTQAITRFGNVAIPDAASSGASAIRVRSMTPGARIDGYAVIHDSGTSDVLPIVGSPRGTGDLVFATFPAESGREIHLYLGNASAEPITATATKSAVAYAKRRAVKHAAAADAIVSHADAMVTIPPFGTQRLVVTGTGTVRVTGPPALRATGTVTVPRTAAASAGGDSGRVGSGIVLVPTSRALLGGMGIRFAGIEDTSTVQASVILMEVNGSAARVRMTLRCALPGGQPGNTVSFSSEQYFPANAAYRYGELARDIIGEARAALGDLHNATLDIDVYGSASPGRIMAFLKMTDKVTGDVIMRHQ